MKEIDYCTLIKFFRKKGFKGNGNSYQIVNVLSKFAPFIIMVYKWANLFKSGLTSLEGDSRKGHPKTASTLEVIKTRYYFGRSLISIEGEI